MTSLEPGFAGEIGETVESSSPWWQSEPQRGERPNVVVVVLDDTGWSDAGCFGSEIATPAIDRMAEQGVRFRNFHVTPLCSPTRACLATGRNHHRVGMRFLAVADTGFPNSRGRLTSEVPTVPQLLRREGYGTFLVGKWHLTPAHANTPAGPYDDWPLSRGFDRFYGFLSGAADQYAPELYDGHTAVRPPDDPEYHLSADLTDRAITFYRDHTTFRPHDPFYLQLAFGATHAPFQAPSQYIEPYEDVFAKGWNQTREDRFDRQRKLGVVPPETELAEPDADVPRWDALSDAERQVAVRTQAAYAGFLEHTDAQIGRLLDALEADGVLEDTVVMLCSDNGAAGDGGRVGTANVIGPYNNYQRHLTEELADLERVGGANGPAHYARGWAMASNTPFRLYKEFVDLGGVKSPLIVRWPGRVPDPGAVRGQYAHIVDLAATVLDVAGVDRDMLDLDGASLVPALTDPEASDPRDTQYYEMIGHRAIWQDGWKAVTRHVTGTPYEDDAWRLYDTRRDFTESHDLAGREPERLRQLQAQWWEQARKNNVLPLDDRPLKQLLHLRSSEAPTGRSRLRLRPGQSHITFGARIDGSTGPMVVRAQLGERDPSDEGVLIASGTSYGGWVLFILDQHLRYEHHLLAERTTLCSPTRLPAGTRSVGIALEPRDERSASVSLLVEEHTVATTTLPRTALQPSFYGVDIGCDPVSRVSPAYAGRGDFSYPAGRLVEVTLEFDEPPTDATTRAVLYERNQ